MQEFFNIRYEFDRVEARRLIEERLRQPGSDYVCVADGVILERANTDPDYNRAVNGGMFCICDSSFVPLYLNKIYGEGRYGQYCGSEIFRDFVSMRRYRMIFLGTRQPVLDSLQRNLAKINPEVMGMCFKELPFRNVEEFDYPGIARMIEEDGADIVWIALGAPKQEMFMSRLKPYLGHGVMIAVGAVFKFYSDLAEARAPRWMVRHHLEFVFRIYQEPKKQLKRCWRILMVLPRLLRQERRRAKLDRQ